MSTSTFPRIRQREFTITQDDGTTEHYSLERVRVKWETESQCTCGWPLREGDIALALYDTDTEDREAGFVDHFCSEKCARRQVEA